jgi:transglycosylase-like protein
MLGVEEGQTSIEHSEINRKDEYLTEEMRGMMFKVPSDRSTQILYWLNKIDSRTWEDREQSILSIAAASKAKTFSIPKLHGAKAFEVIGIPIPSPGFYVVEIRSELLGAALLGRSKPMFVPTTVREVPLLDQRGSDGHEGHRGWLKVPMEPKPTGAFLNFDMPDYKRLKHRLRRLCLHLTGLSLFVTTSSVGLLWLFAPSSTRIPAFQQVRSSYPRSEAVLLDRHHEVLHEFRIDARGRRLQWVSLGEVSPALTSAVIFAEDKRFRQHRGIDWRTLARVVTVGLFSQNVRGASTITMQLASKLLPDLQPKTSHRSLWQKWKQVQAAWMLERSWSKVEILEAYLNLVTFRGELQGITTASRGLFDKKPHGLDSSESVILASLLRSPNASAEQVASRACELSESMNLHLSCSTIASKAQRVLSLPYMIQPEIGLAPHAAWRLLEPRRAQVREFPTQRVCTLDQRLQHFATETLQQHLLSVQRQNVHDGAVLVAENKTGEVLAYVGNVGALASARYVDGVQSEASGWLNSETLSVWPSV